MYMNSSVHRGSKTKDRSNLTPLFSVMRKLATNGALMGHTWGIHGGINGAPLHGWANKWGTNGATWDINGAQLHGWSNKWGIVSPMGGLSYANPLLLCSYRWDTLQDLSHLSHFSNFFLLSLLFKNLLF